MRARIFREHGDQDPWNLKHARGGLVEAEFLAQFLQLRFAPEHPALLTTSTLETFAGRRAPGLLPAADSARADPARPGCTGACRRSCACRSRTASMPARRRPGCAGRWSARPAQADEPALDAAYAFAELQATLRCRPGRGRPIFARHCPAAEPDEARRAARPETIPTEENRDAARKPASQPRISTCRPTAAAGSASPTSRAARWCSTSIPRTTPRAAPRRRRTSPRRCPTFAAAGVALVGLSKDSVASHDRFKAKYGLPFALASDEAGGVVEAYGSWVEKSMYGKSYMGIDRSTFLIDGAGTVRKVWRKVKVPGHVEEVLAAAKELAEDMSRAHPAAERAALRLSAGALAARASGAGTAARRDRAPARGRHADRRPSRPS